MFPAHEPKVHLYQDNHGAKPRTGRGRIADTLCRHNSSNVKTTTNPREVTCRLCLRHMPKVDYEQQLRDEYAEMFESMRTSISELEEERDAAQNEAQIVRRVLNALWSSLDGTSHQHVMLNKHVCISDLVVPHLKEPLCPNTN